MPTAPPTYIGRLTQNSTAECRHNGSGGGQVTLKLSLSNGEAGSGLNITNLIAEPLRPEQLAALRDGLAAAMAQGWESNSPVPDLTVQITGFWEANAKAADIRDAARLAFTQVNSQDRKRHELWLDIEIRICPESFPQEFSLWALQKVQQSISNYRAVDNDDPKVTAILQEARQLEEQMAAGQETLSEAEFEEMEKKALDLRARIGDSGETVSIFSINIPKRLLEDFEQKIQQMHPRSSIIRSTPLPYRPFDAKLG